MSINLTFYTNAVAEFRSKGITLIAVSKTKPVADLQALYNSGQRHFGENYVQEMLQKQEILSTDIHWHFIGHLQTNKVKLILPFVYLIHSVDSLKLLKEINKQAEKAGLTAKVLLQVHIAQEETKYGLDEKELDHVLTCEVKGLPHVKVCGLMGMASFSEDREQVRSEFKKLKRLFDESKEKVADKNAFQTLSMGMSGDYEMAIEEGSNMVRIGSLIFGAREKAG